MAKNLHQGGMAKLCQQTAIGLSVWRTVAVFLLPFLICVGQPIHGEEDQPYGNHFILLIDQSKDTGDVWKYASLNLIRWLYHGEGKGGSVPGLVSFDPSKDLLSVAMFGIHSPASSCYPDKKKSVLPKHLFTWIDELPVQPTEGELKEWFESRENQECRQSAILTPLLTPRWLALSAVTSKLSESSIFGNTYVAVYSNFEGNQFFDLTSELDNYRQKEVEDIIAVKAMLGEISKHYYLDSVAILDKFFPPGKNYGKDFVGYDQYRVIPRQASLEGVIRHGTVLSLDRLAISKDRFELVPGEPSQGRVTLRQEEMAHLEPVALRWRAVDTKGQPWKVGEADLPGPAFATIPLDELNYRQGTAEVDFFAHIEQLIVPVPLGDQIPSGTLEFFVDFRVKTPNSNHTLYSSAVVSTKRRRIELRPIPNEIVARGAFHKDVLLDGKHHAAQWRASDSSGLSRDEAERRIKRRAEHVQYLVYGISSALLVLFLSLMYRWFLNAFYHRPFQPIIRWETGPVVALDFNVLSTSPQILGWLEVTNPHPVPWFGRWFKNQEQPVREAEMGMNLEQELVDLGFELHGDKTPIGFLDGTDADEHGLADHARESLAHGKRVRFYIQPRSIRDFLGSVEELPEEGMSLTIHGAIAFKWQLKSRDLRDQMTQIDLEFDLRLLPEPAHAPVIDFKPSRQAIHYERGKSLAVGQLVLQSTANYTFARPFTYDYHLKAFKDHQPLGGEPFRMRDLQPAIAKLDGTRSIPILLDCDGELVGNPAPSTVNYQFSVLGPHHPESKLGPFPVVLRRNNHPCRPIVELELGMVSYELYWNSAQQVGCRVLNTAHMETYRTIASEIEGTWLRFKEAIPCSIQQNRKRIPLLRLSLGKSVPDNRGTCSFRITTRLEIDEAYLGRVKREPSITDLEELIRIADGSDPIASQGGIWSFEAQGACEPKRFRVDLDPLTVERIEGGRIECDHCRLHLEIQIAVQQEPGIKAQNEMSEVATHIVVPLSLVQNPGSSVLAIDIGTSAISAGVGAIDTQVMQVLDLQKIEVKKGISFGSEDPSNLEKDSKFLPSYVQCSVNEKLFRAQHTEPTENDGDDYFLGERNLEEDTNEQYPAGFCLSNDQSIQPGEPGFLLVPPTRAQMMAEPGLVISSLKSWLGEGSNHIGLKKPIFIKGSLKPQTLVPVHDAMTSALAALHDVYIKPSTNQRDQLVLTCPNTFTFYQRTRLKEAAQNALGQRLKLISEEQIHLVSESDAIAFYFCDQKARDAPPSAGTERLLVYDFGAGTLDLSIIQVKWDERGLPDDWQVLARTGLPVAGHYLDEILAAIIHRLLSDPEVLPEESFEYTYKLAKNPGEKVLFNHQRVIFEFWRNLKTAKHNWDGTSDFEIDLGDIYNEENLVTMKKENDGSLQEMGQSDWLRLEGTNLHLVIPAKEIHGDRHLEEFLKFATQRICSVALASAKLVANQIDTVLISGRGALFPEILPGLKKIFPSAINRDYLDHPQAMKEAVVLGAVISRHFSKLLQRNSDHAAVGRLAILTKNGRLIPEEEWGPDKPIKVENEGFFRIVQVATDEPTPRTDLQGLNRYFYRDLVPEHFPVEPMWANSDLFIHKERVGARIEIRMWNRYRQEANPLDPARAASRPVVPAWPVGRRFLSEELLA